MATAYLSSPIETLDKRNLQSTVVHIQTVHRITVTTRTGVDTNVFSLLCREAGKDTVIQFDKRFEHITSSPRVPRVISQSETTCEGCEYMKLRTSEIP